MEIEQYRARIGLFVPCRKLFTGINEKPRIIRDSNGLFFVLCVCLAVVITILLTIGGVELNPGPKGGKTIEDVLKKLESLDVIMEDITTVRNTMTRMNSSLSHMQEEIKTLKSTCQRLESEKNHLERQMDRLESFSRRSNLLIYNVPEDKNETWKQCEKLVVDIVTSRMRIKLTSDDIERAHRIGRPSNRSRPIVVKFSNYKKKVELLSSISLLKGSNINITEDYTHRVRMIRNELKSYMLNARRDGEYAALRYDRLLINGKTYSLEELKRRTTESVCRFQDVGKTSSDSSPDRDGGRRDTALRTAGVDSREASSSNLQKSLNKGEVNKKSGRKAGGLLTWLDRDVTRRTSWERTQKNGRRGDVGGDLSAGDMERRQSEERIQTSSAEDKRESRPMGICAVRTADAASTAADAAEEVTRRDEKKGTPTWLDGGDRRVLRSEGSALRHRNNSQ
jgi:hypothetical protein